LRNAGVFLLFLFSNDFIGNEVMLLWEVPPTPFAELKKKYSYGIVLTGVGKSEMEPADRMYFGRGADRVTHTLQLYKLGFIQKVLVSGGNGKLYDVNKQEADEMAEVLILMGVPKEDIVIENTSRNTRESALVNIPDTSDPPIPGITSPMYSGNSLTHLFRESSDPGIPGMV